MNDPFNPSLPIENERLVLLQNNRGHYLDKSASPVGRWLNGKLIDILEGSMEAEFTVREEMTNPMGVLHGGIAAAILDEVMGTVVYALGRDFAYTSVNLNCDFLHSASLGEVITAKAKVIRAGKNIVHVEGEITNTDGRIIAKSTSNLIQTNLKLIS